VSRLPAAIDAKLRLPLICAPMFLVSGPELVLAACRAGIVAGLPVQNARTSDEFAEWMDHNTRELAACPDAAPLAVNIVTPKFGGKRWPADMAIVEQYRPPIVITAIGDPVEVVKVVHGYGGIVLHDATTLAHARKAIESGVDGLNLVCGGAGGHAGLLNPFTFVPQVRRFFEGVICLAGALSDGRSIRAAQMLGADLVYMGTRFIATQESRAHPDYKQLIVDQRSSDIVYSPAISGIPASWMRGALQRVGLAPDALPSLKAPLTPDLPGDLRAWRDVWSAGQGIGAIDDIPSTGALVDRLAGEYAAACREIPASYPVKTA
jgi:nitronate monooxygenase